MAVSDLGELAVYGISLVAMTVIAVTLGVWMLLQFTH